MVDEIVTIAAALPLKELATLAVKIVQMLEARTPESELRAGEEAADLAADQLERAKFGG